MLPDDDFIRVQDPRRRRYSQLIAMLVTACLAALTGVWFARTQVHPTGSAVPVSPSPTAHRSTPLGPSPSPLGLNPTAAPAGPVLGSGFSVAYHSLAHQLVTFGGVDSYDTTWVWNGVRWALAQPLVSPPGRYNAAAAYDPHSGLVMLYGGRLGAGELVTDTWAWDGKTWRELDGGNDSLPRGEDSVMAWDDVHGEMFLVGGNTTWRWDGLGWARRPGGNLPPAASLIGMTVDPVTRVLLGASCCSAGQGVTSAWSWNGSAWTQVATHAAPAFTVGLVRDPVHRRVLLFGDPSVAQGREMWSWNGHDWNLLHGVRLPVFPAGAVANTTTRHVEIVGSVAQPVQGHPQPVHLWSWSGSAWTQLA